MNIHPDDIERAIDALDEALDRVNEIALASENESRSDEVAEAILAAVLPAYRARVLNESADEIEFLFLPPPEFQGSEAVGLLRAANILRAASGERVGAAGYTQEDQDNLGQCGR